MTIQLSPGVLENNHVRLEPLAEHHRQAVRVAADDPELWRFHFQNQHGRTFDHWFDLSLAGAIKGDMLAYVVFDRASGAVAGSSSYLAIAPVFQRLEIGSTWYAKPFQGGATNPATKLAMMSHIFETLRWRRVEFKLDARNTRSWAAMRKLGATQEGIFLKHMLLPDGASRDSVCFRVIDDEWPKIKAGLLTRLASGS